jgi:hypothetical protein
MSGFRANHDGSLANVGITGGYVSSAVSTTNSRILFFDISTATIGTTFRARGRSVRCIMD